jgi:dipeptidyl aminopeptidase/acylaminoacyl peptidase
MFLESGYAVLTPDSRGHGESGGELVTYGLLERYDLLDWAHWLQRSGCTSLYGLGESLGAAILIEATALEPPVFRAAVAESAYSDLAAIAESRLPTPALLSKAMVRGGMAYARARYGFDFSEASPLRAIARTHTPILLIHGLEDKKTPPWHSQALAAANPRAVLWLVPNAGHTGAAGAAPSEFRRRVLEWFSRDQTTGSTSNVKPLTAVTRTRAPNSTGALLTALQYSP